jgi:transposase
MLSFPHDAEGEEMGRRRTGVNKVRDIIRYGQTTDLSERQIARALGISRTVVARTLQAFRASGLEYSAVEQLPDSQLQQNLERANTPQDGARYTELAERFPEMVVELKKKGVTLQWLWERYILEQPQGYQYSQYCLHFHRWCRSEEVSMHIEYKAGEAMLVDWAGDKLEVINGTTGQRWALEQFVAILGASELTYVEARESQEEEQWIRANEGAFRYFGGATAALIPDNLKTAVIRADPYEPGLNPVFEDFARHYGVVIMPTRVRRPRDKALVEGAVRLVYQRISARLRGQVFFSLAQVNGAIRELLEEHNRRPFSRLAYSRRQLFERVEMHALRPLPAEPFMLKTTIWATVAINYHVELREDRHYYSVPHPLRRRDPPTRVKIVYDDRVVAIYWDNVRVAQHRRDRTPNGYTTLAEHMPSNHRWYAEWSAEKFLSWAATMGPETAEVITKVLSAAAYPPQAFCSCMGILSLAKRHGSDRLNKACRKALHVGTQSYTRIKNILALGLEEETQPHLDLGALPEHENVRGSGYYN